MIKSDDGHVLFIEPRKGAARELVQDELSAKMHEAMEIAIHPDHVYFGFHTCVCGAKSDTQDWILHTGQITNSLAVHYLECHRDEVPRRELNKVRELPPITPDVIARQKEESHKFALKRLGWRPCRSCGNLMAREHNFCWRCGGESGNPLLP